MKRIFIIILFSMVAFVGRNAKAQSQFAKRDSVTRAFITAVFKEKKTTSFVMDRYMSVETHEEIPMVKKEGFVAFMLDTLVKTQGKLLASSPYEIFSYANFTGPKGKFINDKTDDVMIVAVKNEVVFYLAFKIDRIVSALTFRKDPFLFFLIL